MQQFIKGLKNLLGVGPYLIIIGLLLEFLTIILQQWVSFPVRPGLSLQISLTIFLVIVCLSGMIWFNRSLDLVKVNLLNGKNDLITKGPFSYVRHPLYATLMITVPPLFIIWLADLIFLVPWVLIILVAHFVVYIEERGLVEAFGEDYEKYRKYVPALLPYKGCGGRRYRGD